MLLTLRMQRRAEKAFTKWLPCVFPSCVQSLAEVYRCTRGLFWRKFSVNDCTVLYLAEIKRFREHFEATTYTCVDVAFSDLIFIPDFVKFGHVLVEKLKDTRAHTRIVISLDWFCWWRKGSRYVDSCRLPRIGLFARRQSTLFLFRRFRKISKSIY
jgi:hypothetical protein